MPRERQLCRRLCVARGSDAQVRPGGGFGALAVELEVVFVRPVTQRYEGQGCRGQALLAVDDRHLSVAFGVVFLA